MEAALRKTQTLLTKDLMDLVKNPTVFICCLMPVGFTLFYQFTIGKNSDGSPESTAFITAFLLSIALCTTAGMVSMTAAATALAEEKEKHTLRTLMLANVGAGQIVASRAVVALAAVALIDVLCFLVVGASRDVLLPYLIIGVIGAVPIVLVSLLVGLAARDQMTASLYATPVFILAIAPMVGNMSEEAAEVIRFFPTGGMDALLKLLLDGRLLTTDALMPAAITLAWIAVAAGAFALLYRRLVRDN